MMFPRSAFLTEVNKVRTKSLFYETSYGNMEWVIFTLKEDDIEAHGRSLLSLRKLYMSLVPSDPTEYEFAQTVFGSWSIWETIAKSPLLRKDVAEWRREVEIKIKSQAIRSIAEEMKSGGRSSFGAAKLLLEKGWLDKDTAADAKKKLKAVEEEKQETEALKLLEDDAERLGLRRPN
jgi:hypothetical protein